MSENIAEERMEQLSRWVESHTGLHFPQARWPDLQRGLRAAGRELGFDVVEQFGDWLMATPLTRQQIELLAGHLTIGETYFFRDQRLFQLLENTIFPDLIRERRGTERRLRIWSAGCCTGEEPYSLAILLTRLISDIERWQITIRATDINPSFLARAEAGNYGAWSFRDAPSWLQAEYFDALPNRRFVLREHIRRMVTFDYLNLASDIYPAMANGTNAMDIIFCRNVLMYFDSDRIRQIVGRFHNCLLVNGWMIVSPSETSHILFDRFATVNFPGVILYRKGPPKAAVLEAEMPSVPPPPVVAPVRPVSPPCPAAPAAVPTPTALSIAPALRPARATPSAEAAAERAREAANAGNLTEALQWCDAALATDKMNAGYHYLRATILQEQAAPGDALQALRRALYLDPQFVLAHFAMGNMARHLGRLDEARLHLENAQRLMGALPSEEPVPYGEGITAGRLAEAIDALFEELKMQ